MEFKSNTLNQEVTQVYNHLIDADMKVLADEIWAAFLSKDAHKLVNALNHIQQELMNGGASQSPAYQETRKLYLKCKNMLHMHESKTNKNTVKINENTLRQIVSESVKKVLNEEQGWDGMLSGGELLDKNIKNGNTTGDIRLMCEFLQKYVIPNGEEQDGKFIYRGHAVDVTEINRSIYEAMRYLYKIVKQFGY